jgi:guanylate kinase
MGKNGKLVVVSGPSGVGKTTIVREVLKRSGAEYSISATTRQRRAGEVDGRDYRFVDRPAFEEMARRGEMLEWAEVHGNLYGTPARPVEEAVAAGKTIVLELDVQGGIQVRRKAPDATMVWIMPPSHEELARRLRGRGSESEESFHRRLAKAKDEIETAKASGAYDCVVVNDDLEKAINEILRIVKQ